MKKQTVKDFIEKSNMIHENYFDYSLVDYKNNNTKVKIICPRHGVFEQLPRTHSSGTGCKKCKFDSYKTIEIELLKEFNKIHKYKYDYSLIIYKGSHSKVKIICPVHGNFEQTPEKHKSGYGCQKCGYEKLKLTKGELIYQFKNIHGNKYDYSNVEYFNNHEKINIICPKHGVFHQSSHNHKKGKGCPICKESKGEIEIRNWLIENNFDFESQKRFNDCKNIKPLPFDFYLPEHNLCIEFNGRQHYEIVENDFFGGDKALEGCKIRDKIKVEYCINNDIQLLIIKYDENIKDILNSIIFVV